MDIDAAEIAQCCLKAYRSLPKAGGRPQRRSNGSYEWTVLSGVVMCYESQMTAVTLATGVKCMPYSQLSEHGEILHDSHAEVLVRRSLRAWLLERLLAETRSCQSDPQQLARIFVEYIDNQGNKRWCLHEKISFHMYVSTLPCGEASTSFLKDRKHLEDVERGLTPRENEYESHTFVRGRQTVTSNIGRLLRTKPGRRDSLPSISMSCSDKLYVWNSIGLQGALLSRWLDPVFISSLVISLPEDCAAYVKACTASIMPARSSLHLNVCGVKIPFEHSREEVQRRIHLETGEFGSQNGCVPMEPVASAGGTYLPNIAIAWRRGFRVESFVNGTKMGASSKARRGVLPKSCWSSLSQRAWYLQFLQASELLEDAKLLSGRSYAQNKNPLSLESAHDIYVVRYQEAKRQLRGNCSDSEVRKRIDQFLAETNLKSQTSSQQQYDSQLFSHADDVPILHEWLITPRNCLSFYVDVENSTKKI